MSNNPLPLYVLNAHYYSKLKQINKEMSIKFVKFFLHAGECVIMLIDLGKKDGGKALVYD